MDILAYIFIILLIISNAVVAVIYIREKALDHLNGKQQNYTFETEGKEVTVRLTQSQYTAVINVMALFKYQHNIDILKEKNIKNIE